VETKVTIREAKLADMAAVAKLGSRYGMGKESSEPPPSAENISSPIEQKGWVMVTEQGEVVGFLNSIFSRFTFRGRELRTASPSGWVVDERYRGQSMAMLTEFLRLPGVDLFLDTTARHPADKIFQALGFRRIPCADYDLAPFWILDAGGFIRSFLRRKGKEALSFLAPLGGIAIAMVETVKGRNAIVREGRAALARDTLQWREAFGPEFDVFWKKLSEGKRETLLALRDRKTLNDHFDASVKAGRAWVLCAFERQELAAYAVFFRQDHPASGLRRVRLADFQCLPTLPAEKRKALLRSILGAACSRFRGEKLEMLEVLGFHGWVRDEISLLAPYTRRLEFWPYLYKAVAPGLAKELAESSAWEPSIYDGDASL
jgi:hypothetical protein